MRGAQEKQATWALPEDEGRVGAQVRAGETSAVPPMSACQMLLAWLWLWLLLAPTSAY